MLDEEEAGLSSDDVFGITRKGERDHSSLNQFLFSRGEIAVASAVVRFQGWHQGARSEEADQPEASREFEETHHYTV